MPTCATAAGRGAAVEQKKKAEATVHVPLSATNGNCVPRMMASLGWQAQPERGIDIFIARCYIA